MPCWCRTSTSAMKSSRRAVARGGGEVAGGLVAPRAVERVLGDRQQLDVGEAHVARVRRQAWRHLAVGEEAAGVVGRRASTSRGAPRRSPSARRARWRGPRARHPLGVAASRAPTATPPRRYAAASRCGRRMDRTCRRGSRRAARRCGTCSARRARRRAACPPRCPTSPARRSGWARRSQSLKSPTTETAAAFGAHTAKVVCGLPAGADGCAPSFS